MRNKLYAWKQRFINSTCGTAVFVVAYSLVEAVIHVLFYHITVLVLGFMQLCGAQLAHRLATGDEHTVRRFESRLPWYSCSRPPFNSGKIPPTTKLASSQNRSNNRYPSVSAGSA